MKVGFYIEGSPNEPGDTLEELADRMAKDVLQKAAAALWAFRARLDGAQFQTCPPRSRRIGTI